MKIRQEKVEDFDQIDTLIKVAFETAEHSDGKEQEFVKMLRTSSTYVPALALVAEIDNQLVAHIMLTIFHVGNIKALLLAPLTVKLEYRNQNIGSALTKKALSLAKELGYKAVFVVGHETYYPRFGFRPSITFGIHNVNGIPSNNVMALELQPNVLQNISENVDFFEQV